MGSEDFSLRLVDILRERAHNEFGVPQDQPQALLQLLVEGCGLKIGEARSVLAGEAGEAALSDIALRSLAQTFSLSPELLSCQLRPTSNDVLLHTIMEVTDGHLNVDGCDFCADLDARMHAAERDDDHGDLLELCADIIGHTGFFTDSDDGLFDDIAVAEAMQAMMPSSLQEVLGQLDPAARIRVMAYAYQELAQTTDGESASVFAAHARLRASLAAVARSAFDVLSQSPDGSLSLDELMTALPAGTTLEMIEHALERGVEGLGEACLSLSEKPLAVIPGPPVRLQLSSAACSAWRALVHAEQLSAAA